MGIVDTCGSTRGCTKLSAPVPEPLLLVLLALLLPLPLARAAEDRKETMSCNGSVEGCEGERVGRVGDREG